MQRMKGQGNGPLTSLVAMIVVVLFSFGHRAARIAVIGDTSPMWQMTDLSSGPAEARHSP